ncbi:hypothetical protein [Scatolibacter rhodanostii]|uniref:hypothetical protein n=1 Tax=Scatolibacter rhodanostii TaxID=2014781 RepID=UPI000C07C669|nr:hypothetical protein [Scatolibacter rhodanostii]
MNHFDVITTKEEREQAGLKQYKFVEAAGTITAVLNFRAWGKNMNLGCFFRTEAGDKFCVYLWRSKLNPDVYGPRSESINFAEVKNKTKWNLSFEKTRSGKIFLADAKELG